jgi:hypothetical protein
MWLQPVGNFFTGECRLVLPWYVICCTLHIGISLLIFARIVSGAFTQVSAGEPSVGTESLAWLCLRYVCLERLMRNRSYKKAELIHLNLSPWLFGLGMLLIGVAVIISLTAR